MREMGKVIYGALWIIAAALALKLALWAYQGYGAGGEQHQLQEVFDHDIICTMNADTGQCLCHHHETGQRISISYDECVSRASNPRRP